MRRYLALGTILAILTTTLVWAPPQTNPTVSVVSTAPSGGCQSNEVKLVKSSGAMYACIGSVWTLLPNTSFYGNCSASVASASAITVDSCNLVTITGSVAIITINTCNAANKGRPLVVLCGAATSALVDASMTNVKMAGNFTCTADDSISFVCDGTNWIEQARAVN